MKPPMPDPLHLFDAVQLKDRLTRVEQENDALRWYVRWLLQRTKPNESDEFHRFEYEAIRDAAFQMSRTP